MKLDALLDDFERLRPVLEAWCERGRGQLISLLAQGGLDVQMVTGRVKTADSLRRKLARPDRTYQRLTDVTDLVGLRVVTAFEETVDDVARAVEGAWRLDLVNCTDKRSFSDHSRFGYRSLHYVCAVPEGVGLPGALRFEVQIRTVLQHAWAEVEHDLGYKATAAVPAAIRRRFSRVASLLELADQEFGAIRADLRAYRREVNEGVGQPASAIALDVVSLAALVRSPVVERLDERLAGALGRPLGGGGFFFEYLVALLRQAGLTTTAHVTDAIDEHQEAAMAIVEPYFAFATRTWSLDPSSLTSIDRGYGLFFVAHVALLRRDPLHVGRVARLAQTYRSLDYPDDEREAQRVAGALVEALLPVLDRLDGRAGPASTRGS